MSNLNVVKKSSRSSNTNNLFINLKNSYKSIKDLKEVFKLMIAEQDEDLYKSTIINLLLKQERYEYEVDEIYKYLSRNNNFFDKISKMYTQVNMARELCSKMKYRKIEKNTVFFKTGQRGESFYFIIDGVFSLLAPIRTSLELRESEFIDYLDRLKRHDEIEVLERVKRDNPLFVKNNDYFEKLENEVYNSQTGGQSRRKTVLGYGKKHFDDTMNYELLHIRKKGISVEEYYIKRIHPKHNSNVGEEKENDLIHDNKDNNPYSNYKDINAGINGVVKQKAHLNLNKTDDEDEEENDIEENTPTNNANKSKRNSSLSKLKKVEEKTNIQSSTISNVIFQSNNIKTGNLITHDSDTIRSHPHEAINISNDNSNKRTHYSKSNNKIKLKTDKNASEEEINQSLDKEELDTDNLVIHNNRSKMFKSIKSNASNLVNNIYGFGTRISPDKLNKKDLINSQNNSIDSSIDISKYTKLQRKPTNSSGKNIHKNEINPTFHHDTIMHVVDNSDFSMKIAPQVSQINLNDKLSKTKTFNSSNNNKESTSRTRTVKTRFIINNEKNRNNNDKKLDEGNSVNNNSSNSPSETKNNNKSTKDINNKQHTQSFKTENSHKTHNANANANNTNFNMTTNTLYSNLYTKPIVDNKSNNLFGDRRVYTVYIYKVINQMTEGMSFGELALESAKGTRAITFIAKTDVVTAYINRHYYNLCINESKKKSNKLTIEFIVKVPIFKDIPITIIEKKLLDYLKYQSVNYQKLLLSDENSSFCYPGRVVFLKKGEFEVMIKKSPNEILEIIKYYGASEGFLDAVEKEEKILRQKTNSFLIFKSKRMSLRLGYIKDMDILGLSDTINLMKGDIFYEYICKENNSELFYIDLTELMEVMEGDDFLNKNFKQYLSDKKNKRRQKLESFYKLQLQNYRRNHDIDDKETGLLKKKKNIKSVVVYDSEQQNVEIETLEYGNKINSNNNYNSNEFVFNNKCVIEREYAEDGTLIREGSKLLYTNKNKKKLAKNLTLSFNNLRMKKGASSKMEIITSTGSINHVDGDKNISSNNIYSNLKIEGNESGKNNYTSEDAKIVDTKRSKFNESLIKSNNNLKTNLVEFKDFKDKGKSKNKNAKTHNKLEHNSSNNVNQNNSHNSNSSISKKNRTSKMLVMKLSKIKNKFKRKSLMNKAKKQNSNNSYIDISEENNSISRLSDASINNIKNINNINNSTNSLQHSNSHSIKVLDRKKNKSELLLSKILNRKKIRNKYEDIMIYVKSIYDQVLSSTLKQLFEEDNNKTKNDFITNNNFDSTHTTKLTSKQIKKAVNNDINNINKEVDFLFKQKKSKLNELKLANWKTFKILRSLALRNVNKKLNKKLKDDGLFKETIQIHNNKYDIKKNDSDNIIDNTENKNSTSNNNEKENIFLSTFSNYFQINTILPENISNSNSKTTPLYDIRKINFINRRNQKLNDLEEYDLDINNEKSNKNSYTNDMDQYTNDLLNLNKKNGFSFINYNSSENNRRKLSDTTYDRNGNINNGIDDIKILKKDKHNKYNIDHNRNKRNENNTQNGNKTDHNSDAFNEENSFSNKSSNKTEQNTINNEKTINRNNTNKSSSNNDNNKKLNMNNKESNNNFNIINNKTTNRIQIDIKNNNTIKSSVNDINTSRSHFNHIKKEGKKLVDRSAQRTISMKYKDDKIKNLYSKNKSYIENNNYDNSNDLTKLKLPTNINHKNIKSSNINNKLVNTHTSVYNKINRLDYLILDKFSDIQPKDILMSGNNSKQYSKLHERLYSQYKLSALNQKVKDIVNFKNQYLSSIDDFNKYWKKNNKLEGNNVNSNVFAGINLIKINNKKKEEFISKREEEYKKNVLRSHFRFKKINYEELFNNNDSQINSNNNDEMINKNWKSRSLIGLATKEINSYEIVSKSINKVKDLNSSIVNNSYKKKLLKPINQSINFNLLNKNKI